MTTDYFGKSIEVHPDTGEIRGSFNESLQVHEPELIEEVIKILKTIDRPVMFDVGACSGSYAMLDLVVDVEIYSVEPVSRSFDALQYNVKTNRSKTKCFNLGIMNYIGEGDLHEVTWTGGSALSMINGIPSFSRKQNVTKKIEVTTIDELVKKVHRTPDLIKIDVEGAEWFALDGAKETLKKKPFIILEWEDENLNQFKKGKGEILELLEGYEIRELKNNLICSFNSTT